MDNRFLKGRNEIEDFDSCVSCGTRAGASAVPNASYGPDGELIKDLLLPTPPHTWRRRTGGQLKTKVVNLRLRTMENGLDENLE